MFKTEEEQRKLKEEVMKSPVPVQEEEAQA